MAPKDEGVAYHLQPRDDTNRDFLPMAKSDAHGGGCGTTCEDCAMSLPSSLDNGTEVNRYTIWEKSGLERTSVLERASLFPRSDRERGVQKLSLSGSGSV